MNTHSSDNPKNETRVATHSPCDLEFDLDPDLLPMLQAIAANAGISNLNLVARTLLHCTVRHLMGRPWWLGVLTLAVIARSCAVIAEWPTVRVAYTVVGVSSGYATG